MESDIHSSEEGGELPEKKGEKFWQNRIVRPWHTYLDMIKKLTAEMRVLKAEGDDLKKHLLKKVDEKKHKKVLSFIKNLAV